MVADFHSTLVRWRNHICRLLNIHEDNIAKQAELHTAEPLVPEPSAFEVQFAIEKLKSHK